MEKLNARKRMSFKMDEKKLCNELILVEHEVRNLFLFGELKCINEIVNWVKKNVVLLETLWVRHLFPTFFGD